MQRRNSRQSSAVLEVMSRILLFAGFAALLSTSACQAQTTAPAPDAAAPKSQNEVPQASRPAPGTLSEQLSRSGGVIQPPPQVDRKIEAPTPDPGAQSMPVIPPPGTPGGDPTIKPK
jgi:hypothetical protein